MIDYVGAVVLDMLVTISDELNCSLQVENIPVKAGNTDKKDAIIHLVATKIKSNRHACSIYELESVVFSVDLKNEKVYGPVSIGVCSNEVSSDFSDVIHYKMYCNNICNDLQLDKSEINQLWNCRQMTKYCRCLSRENYNLLYRKLLDVHSERSYERAKNPRVSRDQNFSDDFLDKALALFVSRIAVIMNNSLYWGEVENGQFSLNSPEMRTILK